MISIEYKHKNLIKPLKILGKYENTYSWQLRLVRANTTFKE